MKRRINESETKSLPITQQMVRNAYRKVKSNHGSAGIDQVSLEEFQGDLSNNLYKLWNRMSSGSYFPPSVREVSIPKSNGKKRKLGIPTVGDRIAQQVMKDYLEPRLEEAFLWLPTFEKCPSGSRTSTSERTKIHLGARHGY